MMNLANLAGGECDAAPALQAALDQGGEIRVPAGEYLLGHTLRMPSRTALLADRGATFHLADGAGTDCRSFMITNANPGNGNADITLQGGTWDANNAGNPRGRDGDPFAFSGVAINFTNVQQLTVRNLAIHNPESFFIRLGEVRDFRVEAIVLSADVLRPNQDGVHVGGFSERGTIRGIRASGAGVPNDDMVALNADDDVERQLNLGMRRGPIRQVTVEDIEAEDAYTFVRLLSVDAPIEDIAIRRLRGNCRIHGVNLNNWRFPKGVGAIRRVVLEDLDLGKTTLQNAAIVKVSLRVEDLRLRRFTRGAATLPDVQTLLIDNQQDLRLQFGSRTLACPAAEGYTQAGGDIEDLVIRQA